MTTILATAASNAILSAILAIFTLAVTRVWRSPQLAHGLWLLILLKLITPPLMIVSPPMEWLAEDPTTTEPSPPATATAASTIASPIDEVLHLPESSFAVEPAMVAQNIELAEPSAVFVFDDPQTSIGPSIAIDTTTAASPDPNPPSSHWPAAVAIVWLAGAIIYLIVVVRRCIGFRRILSASTTAGAEITLSAGRLASKLGLRRRPPVRMVEATIPPLVWSPGLQPCIVLPAALWAEFSPAQRDALLAHELAHVRRRDYLIRWLELLSELTPQIDQYRAVL